MVRNLLVIVIVLSFEIYAVGSPSIKVIGKSYDYTIVEINSKGAFEVKDSLIDGIRYSYIKSKTYSFRKPGEPWLPEVFFALGIPFNSSVNTIVLNQESEIIEDKFILPYPATDSAGLQYEKSDFDRAIYSSNRFFPEQAAVGYEPAVMRYAKIAHIGFSPFRFNPVTKQLQFIKKVRIKIEHKSNNIYEGYQPVSSDPLTEKFLKDGVLNYSIAKTFMAKMPSATNLPQTEYWYNPDKVYYKIYLKVKGLYEISYSDFLNAGVTIAPGTKVNQIQMYNDGNNVPVEIKDDGDGIFNNSDHIRFIGKTPTPTPYATQNIYNNTNVYWITFEADSNQITRYRYKNSAPVSWDYTDQRYQRVDFYEKDSIYERLGYAPDGNRDYWYWDKASGYNNSPTYRFRGQFQPFKNFNLFFPFVKIRVNMHGMTTYNCFYDHNVRILVNDKFVGEAKWNGQESYTFEGSFMVSVDSVNIYPDGNYVTIETPGTQCHPSKSDEIRVNWFEFTYWSDNRVAGNVYNFSSVAGSFGAVRHWLWQWTSDTMKVYIPSRAEILINPTFLNDADKTVLFVDTLNGQTEYFAYGDSVFLKFDSIRADIRSSLRDVTNGADYLIISHRKFSQVAERLKIFRETHFPDTSISSPRVKIVYVDDIYDEFSYGLLDPMALQKFVKHAFENWQSPAVSYVVLLGDMSYDYRGKYSTSRPNYIPSIPHHSYTYGQSASDNGVVTVAGNDILPDAGLGRISIETVEEGNAILDKLETYPDDNNKVWKETVLLMASGLNPEDELRFGFNEASMSLDTNIVQSNGYRSRKIFRYPNKPEHLPYQGTTADIRSAFNEGCILANYYGHGGGYQWDETFLNEDIYIIQNGRKMPLVLSVTCYTAHFDNQNVFGEQFLKVPGKGAIGFFGSSGLTHWEIGKYINTFVFDEIFLRKNTVSGSTFLNAKALTPPIGYYANQIALLTYLGDPLLKVALPTEVDLAVTANDIDFTPSHPLVGDSVVFNVKIENLGPVTNDSVYVQMFFSGEDSSGLFAEKKIKVFGNRDSVEFYWKPFRGGLYEITVKVNEKEQLPEPDHLDNQAKVTLPVYNISEPNIISPNTGVTVTANDLEFLISDIGFYIDKTLEYYIEIDTSSGFSHPLISAGPLYATDGLLRWKPSQALSGEYYWRTRIFDGDDFGRWSDSRLLTVGNVTTKGYTVQGKLLKSLSTSNLYFSQDLQALLLRKDFLPPKPQYPRIIENIALSDSALFDSTGMGCLATDGKYLYVANLTYWLTNYTGDTTGNSKIYKIGTGKEGTIAGQYYGPIPNFARNINESMTWFSDGYIYVATGDPYYLMKVHPDSGLVDSVFIPSGLIDKDSAKVRRGSFFISADSMYVYNLSIKDTLGRTKYTIKIFDPRNGWSVVGKYYHPDVNSFAAMTSFFVKDNNFYPYENYTSGYMRRIGIYDGYFDEEWVVSNPNVPSEFVFYYAWAFDWKNNIAYATRWRPGVSKYPVITSFIGKYLDAQGSLTSQQIGPASKWNSSSYELIQLAAAGSANVVLQGLNNETKAWDTLSANLPPNFSLDTISTSKYSYMRFQITFTDSSFNISQPLGLKSFKLNFESLPELVVTKQGLNFTPDSLLQGLPITLSLKVNNYGESKADSVLLEFYLDGGDTTYTTRYLDVPADSSANVFFDIPTAPLIFNHNVKVIAKAKVPEFYTFNNIIDKDFFVARDSINPVFSITIDGKEIINGDIISKNPEIIVTLRDNSPLPLDTAYFTLIFDNVPMNFSRDDIEFIYTPYPNSEAKIIWTPELKKGRHTFDVLAKDGSGNFFDTTYRRTIFNVYEEDDIAIIYNYPNPFSSGTHFTFELRGNEVPDELKIRIFTVTGRLVKELILGKPDLNISFNKIYWDGKDQDGDDLSNGVYFYKVITKFKDKTKTSVHKLAKVR